MLVTFKEQQNCYYKHTQPVSLSETAVQVDYESSLLQPMFTSLVRRQPLAGCSNCCSCNGESEEQQYEEPRGDTRHFGSRC